eukprot:458633_1
MELMRFLIANDFDSDAVIDELCDIDQDPFNHYTHSYLFLSYLNANKFYAKLIKEHLQVKHNDSDPIVQFSFGPVDIFKYNTYFRDKCDTYIDSASYGSLKEECLNNNIHVMLIGTFNSLVEKAFWLVNSVKGRKRKARDVGYDNTIYQIPVFSYIKISHVLVLLMHCNFDKLQRVYKAKGCRKIKQTEPLNKIKERNKEIGHWYSLLWEVIYFYGDMAASGDVFYMGLNIEVVFNTYTPVFTSPVSTTTAWRVAHRFSKGIGVVLKLTSNYGCMDSYMDCNWVSDYPNEYECLFFKAERLQIVDIQNFDGLSRVVNVEHVAAFTLFSNIFSGNYFIFKLKKKRKIERLLMKLIQNYCE